MAAINLQHLDYGIIYIESDSVSSAPLRQASELLQKLVYPMEIRWVNNPDSKKMIVAARRFNVGNIGRYATVRLEIEDGHSSLGLGLDLGANVEKFAHVLLDVGSSDEGDAVVHVRDEFTEYNMDFHEYMPKAAPQDKTRVHLPKVKLWKNLKKNVHDWFEDSVVCAEDASCLPTPEPKIDKLQIEEDIELERLEQERRQAIERIRRDIVNYIARYHDDPKELMAELLRGKVVVGRPGRILVNGDMKIILPDYDEMEIEMPAMCRTLYILFMKRRLQGGGIVLKNMDEHRDEILNIYSMVKPGANRKRVAHTVDNLCNPLSESLNQTISKVNRRIKDVITDKELVKKYIITGKKGEPYSIGLAPEYLELPRAVTS